ncbi:MAG: hypothetical protein IPF63_05950 [Bacteroidetes bacterium]|nr:hypothetical protein [Bacteroidota bacterium]
MLQTKEETTMEDPKFKGSIEYNCEVQELNLCDLNFRSDANFYMLLHHAMVFGKIENWNFQCLDNSILKNWQQYLIELRVWNDTEETHVFYRMGKWQMRTVDLNGEFLHYDTESFIWRTENEHLGNNYSKLIEERGTEIIFPKDWANEKEIKIKERHFISYNAFNMPQVVDSCIIGFKK